MIQTIQMSPPKSVLLIMDRTCGIVPDAMGGELVSATNTCIAVGTLCEHDGVTDIALANEPLSTECHFHRVFDGTIETPTRRVSLCTILDEVSLEVEVKAERTRIEIWTNRLVEPSDIRITAF